MSDEEAFRLPGLTAAAFTPMNQDGSLNLDRIEDLVDFLVNDGVAGLFVLGSTGEGLSLTNPERRLVTEAFVESSAGRLPVVVHVGHNCLDEAQALARHAQEAGASAIAAVAPSYFKPDSPETLVKCLAKVAAGAPDLPAYYYHIPSLTGVDVDLDNFIGLCCEHVPTIAGVKFSDPRLHHCLAVQTREEARALDFVFGVDEMLLSAWAAGFRGAVGTTYNFAAPLYRRIIACYKRGDLDTARELQVCSASMIDLILQTCGRGGFKALMNEVGVDCGPCRLPQVSPEPERVGRMMRALEAVGFFQWGRKR